MTIDDDPFADIMPGLDEEVKEEVVEEPVQIEENHWIICFPRLLRCLVKELSEF